jgi:SNF2 family DNA or RNA helicase
MSLQENLNLPFPLRPYQEEGFHFLIENQRALLGDDMGLGKTVQTIVALKAAYEKKGFFRVLIVVPNPLITNWIEELSLWFEDSKVQILKGDLFDRTAQLKRSKGFVLCSYEQMRASFTRNHLIPEYEIVIFDEAQKIKNSSSATHLAAKRISKKKMWMLSGTPLENRIEDVISIFSILKWNTIQSGNSRIEITNSIAPYLLRRLKTDVLDELPELIEENVYINMTGKQKTRYDNTFNKKDSLDLNQSSNVLALITELKKICNYDDESNESGKLNHLKEILDELNRKKEKVIVFSQYVKTLEYIMQNLNQNAMMYHGGMKNVEKDNVLKEFKDSKNPEILLMSLKAGGVGLNLQEASTVILFDRWWNPAVESQAIARAHRMGNKKIVHAIKFVTPDSIETRILQLLHEKEELFEDVIEGAVDKRQEFILRNLLEKPENGV